MAQQEHGGRQKVLIKQLLVYGMRKTVKQLTIYRQNTPSRETTLDIVVMVCIVCNKLFSLSTDYGHNTTKNDLSLR